MLAAHTTAAPLRASPLAASRVGVTVVSALAAVLMRPCWSISFCTAAPASQMAPSDTADHAAWRCVQAVACVNHKWW